MLPLIKNALLLLDTPLWAGYALPPSFFDIIMTHTNLPDFLAYLETIGELKRVTHPVDTYLEMTEIADRVLQKQGPALLFEKVLTQGKPNAMPVLANLFGTPRRVALGMGKKSDSPLAALREVGELLAFLKEPVPPESLKDALSHFPLLKQVLTMRPSVQKNAPWQAKVWEGDRVNLFDLPLQHCWPEDAAPLVTWGLVITQGPYKKRQNLGVYRQQLIGKNRLIMRWLAHRGGALDFADHKRAHPSEPFPVAVVIGADPATILAAVTPIPDTLSEYQFAGLLRGQKTALVRAGLSNLQIPVSAEIVLEGVIDPSETALEGPFGDHTGYYNEQARFPVFQVKRVSMKENALYHSTYTGRPPDEPAMLGVALNEVFIPILKKQFPEIVDFYLPPEGCSYRLACVSIKKQYPGHARRVMMGIWGVLRQFMYTKFIWVVDDDVDVRNWKEVIWAMTTRSDPARDTVIIENTPIDYLDFASPKAGLGSKMGVDATHKWQGETEREWGRAISMAPNIKTRVDAMWEKLGL